jgi:hypothetical protein
MRFFVGGDTRYDLKRIGLAYEEEPAEPGRRQAKRASPEQYLFDTTEPGNYSMGHTPGTTLSEEEKACLLEYLKTL